MPSLSDVARDIQPTEMEGVDHSVLDTTINPITLSTSTLNDINLSQLVSTSTNTSPYPTSNNSQTGRRSTPPRATNYLEEPCVLLYHEEEINCAIQEYCQPIAQSFDNDQDHCNFHRNCIISKSKLFDQGSVDWSKSPTSLNSIGCWPSNKNNYKLVDTRIIKCFNPTCKHPTTKNAKIFHYVCYMHMLSTSGNEEMEHLVLENDNDKLFELVDDSVPIQNVKHYITNQTHPFIFPYCGKRCFNKLTNHRKKEVNKEDNSGYATSCNWENDGDDNKKSSIGVLIDWMSTEENCSKYFGGLDSSGRTNGDRKEVYHLHIRDLIIAENGK